MWFIGQRVVCVNDRFPTHILEWTASLPRKGQVYTIRSIVSGPNLYSRKLTVGFHLNELRTIQDRLGFLARRFVPIFEHIDRARKTNLLELVRQVGDAAMKSVAEEIKRERSGNGDRAKC